MKMMILLDNEARLNAGKCDFPDLKNQFVTLTGDYHNEVEFTLKCLNCLDDKGTTLAPYAITWVCAKDDEPWTLKDISEHCDLHRLEESVRLFDALPKEGRLTVCAYCEALDCHNIGFVNQGIDLYNGGKLRLYADAYPVDVLRQKVDSGLYGDVSDRLKPWIDFESWAECPDMKKRLRLTKFGTLEFLDIA